MSRYVQSGAQHLLILDCGTKSAAKLSTDKILLIYKNEKENKKGWPLKKFVFFTLFYVKFYIYYRLRQLQYTGGALLFDFIIWWERYHADYLVFLNHVRRNSHIL